MALGLAVTRVERLANLTRHRQAGDCPRLASPGISAVLDLEESSAHGSTARPSRCGRVLIRKIAHENPLWGAPRIHGELLKLGVQVSQATVAKYMARPTTPPSQSWRTFLTNHVHQIAAADFFVVPTATYRLLFVLVILAHERRRIVISP